jgi:hypothetical protein
VRPYDKQDRPLFGETWDRVHHYGTQLLALGYTEHAQKPNLFVRKYRRLDFYADLRGSNIIPIWNDPRPMFYWRFKRQHDPRVAPRVVSIEATRLAPMPIRLSHRPTIETLELLANVDHTLFERPEPARVPPAPVPGAPRPEDTRSHLYEAVRPSTGEFISASAKSAGATHLVCPDCRGAVQRRWDSNQDRYVFRHLGKDCVPETR